MEKWQKNLPDAGNKKADRGSEAIYENRLKPFTLSAGLNYSQKYTNNEDRKSVV